MLGIHRCPICGAVTRGPCACEKTAKYWAKLVEIGYAKLVTTRPEALEVPLRIPRPFSAD